MSSTLIREQHPLRLNIDVATPAGRHARWAWDEPNPANAAMGLNFSTVMPGGFERMSCTLERDPRLSYQDLEPLSTITVMGPGGQVAWQGRLEKTPDTGGYQEQVSPEAVGYQAALEDNSRASEIYVDQDQSQWHGVSVQRRINFIGSEFSPNDASQAQDASTGKPSVLTSLQGDWGSAEGPKPKPVVEGWYDAGSGNRIGYGYYAWTKGANISPADEHWHWAGYVLSDDIASAYESTGELRGAGPGSIYVLASAGRRFAMVQLYYDFSPAGIAGLEYEVYWQPVVYGDHGLPGYGPNPVGYLASDIVAHALNKWTIGISFSLGAESTIKPSSFVINHLAFREPTTVAEMIKQATRFELEDWAIWEGPTFYMHPRGEEPQEWRTRVAPAQLQETGPQVSRLWNGVIVAFTDVSGVTRSVGPIGSGMDVESALLEDPDPENPLNQTGDKKWAPLKMGVSTAAGAEKVGAKFLAESKHLDTSGQAQLVGHVEDASGVEWPAWMVRAGDTVSVVDAADTGARRIVHSSYDDPSKGNTLQLDQPPDGMQALLERLSVALVPLGLS